MTYCTVFGIQTVKGREWYYAPREQKGPGSPPTKCFIMYVLRLYCNNNIICIYYVFRQRHCFGRPPKNTKKITVVFTMVLRGIIPLVSCYIIILSNCFATSWFSNTRDHIMYLLLCCIHRYKCG